MKYIEIEDSLIVLDNISHIKKKDYEGIGYVGLMVQFCGGGEDFSFKTRKRRDAAYNKIKLGLDK